MNGYEALAGAISDLADSAEDAVAGGGSAHAAVQQAVERGREIAYTATMAARGKITPDDVARWLGRDEGGGETLIVGRPGVKPEPPRRPWWSLRKWLDGRWSR